MMLNKHIFHCRRWCRLSLQICRLTLTDYTKSSLNDDWSADPCCNLFSHSGVWPQGGGHSAWPSLWLHGLSVRPCLPVPPESEQVNAIIHHAARRMERALPRTSSRLVHGKKNHSKVRGARVRMETSDTLSLSNVAQWLILASNNT